MEVCVCSSCGDRHLKSCGKLNKKQASTAVKVLSSVSKPPSKEVFDKVFNKGRLKRGYLRLDGNGSCKNG